MVFLHDWEEFEHAAETMYQQSPEQCRYTMKYTHKKGQLVLKLTDNVKCIQFKSEVMPDLKKIERLTGNLMAQMASSEE